LTPWPTETPAAVLTATMNPTLVEEQPTLTILPTTTTAEENNKPSLPFCGSILIIPFGIVLLLKKILV
jgi:hypothetical protein